MSFRILSSIAATLMLAASAPAQAQHAHHDHAHAAPARAVADTIPKSDTTPKQDTATRAGLYVCPMHIDVTSKTEGRCPKCGMKLVKELPKRAKDSTALAIPTKRDSTSPVNASPSCTCCTTKCDSACEECCSQCAMPEKKEKQAAPHAHSK